MTLQIGRITLDNPMRQYQAGNLFGFEGWINDTDINAVKALRQGLVGHVGNVDEPVVPVVASYDSHLDGFYRVRAAEVEIAEGGHALKVYRWFAELERVSDYSAPLVESILVAPTVRTNGSSVADGIDWHAIPDSMYAQSYDVGQDIPSPAGLLDTENEGANSIAHIRRTSGTNIDLEDATALYYSKVDDWYDGACLLEYDYTGSGDWYPVVGRQVRNFTAIGDPDRWRLGNGILRVVHGTSNDTELEVSRWLQGSSAYSTAKTFELGDGSAPSTATTRGTVSVLRNSPEIVTIRIGATDNGERRITIDLTLKRGCPWIEVVFGCRYTSGLNGFGIQMAESETTEDLDNPTAFSGLEDAGIKATSADGDGLYYFLASSGTVTLNTSTRVVYLTSAATSGSFILGLAEEDDNGTSFPTFDSPGYWTLNYLKGMSETVRVVEQ